MPARRLLDSLAPGGAGRRLVLPILLGLVAAVVLVEGALHRPPAAAIDEATTNALAARPTPAPTATPFRPELEKVPLMYFSDYWLQLAGRARSGLVTLGQAGLPAMRIRPGFALLTLEDADVIASDPNGTSEGRLLAADARVGAAVFQLDASAQAEPLAPATGLHAGMLVALVSLDPEHGLRITPGTVASQPSETSDQLDVSIPYPGSLGVGAIVDLDGQLAGVALRTRDGVRALTVRGAQALTDRLIAAPICRGVEVAAIDEDIRSRLRLASGVMVLRVWPEAFAEAPDLQPGDVLIRWGGQELATPDGFATAYDALPPGEVARFVVRRGDRRLTGAVEMPGRDGRPVGLAPAELPWLDAVARWTRPGPATGDDPGFLILHVTEGGPADRAGIEDGDLLTRVDGRPLRWPAARALLDDTPTPRPALLLVRRGEISRLALLGKAKG